jgi:hypothetical protein
VFTAVIGGIASGAWGAGDSYFATAIAAMCLLSGIVFSRTLSPHPQPLSQGAWGLKPLQANNYLTRALLKVPPYRNGEGFRVGLIPLLYILYGIAVFHTPTTGPIFEQIASFLNIQPNVRGTFYDSATYETPGYANIGYLVTQDDVDAGYRIVEMIRNAGKPVLSEEAGFSLVAGKEVVTNPTQLLNLWKAGVYNGDELIRMIENREFAFIILRAQFYPPHVLEAIWQHYTVDEVIEMNTFDYLILRPNTE